MTDREHEIDRIAREFHEFINHDPKIKGHRIVHEVLAKLQEIVGCGLSNKARAIAIEALEQLTSSTSCEKEQSVAIDALKELREIVGPRWIRVSERLPEKNDT